MIGVGKQFDVLVVGGGPAGLAAAATAAEHGARVAIVDDNPSLGGQIWRAGVSGANRDAVEWLERARSAGVEVISGARVFDAPKLNLLLAEKHDGLFELQFEKLVLATGARERFLPFPGWTLPNVMGAGALQALVKAGFPIEGKRVVVAGTGPLLLAVAAYLREHGAEIPLLCEQASITSLFTFGFSLLGHRQKISQGLSLRKQLPGTRLAFGSWPVAADGDEVLKSVVISHGQKFEQIDCDFQACGFHLVPNTELATLMGCRLRNGFVEVNQFQETSLPGIFCAGEPTGIGGVELSLIEGQIAGYVAAGNHDAPRSLFRRRQKFRKFSQALDRTFVLRSELREIALPETIVCRCEDVTLGRVKQHSSWRAAKLQTRCGMGPCQGRVCGPITEFLCGWPPESNRPPVFPARIENLGADLRHMETEQTMRGTQ